jgi:hypothetical protein
VIRDALDVYENTNHPRILQLLRSVARSKDAIINSLQLKNTEQARDLVRLSKLEADANAVLNPYQETLELTAKERRDRAEYARIVGLGLNRFESVLVDLAAAESVGDPARSPLPILAKARVVYGSYAAVLGGARAFVASQTP